VPELISVFPVGALVASGFALWYAIAAARAVALSAPNQLTQRQKAVEDAQLGLQRSLNTLTMETTGKLDSYDAKLISWRTDIEAVLEAVEDLLDRTEKKRRSVTQANRRAEEIDPASPGDPTQMSHAQLRERARAMGMDVM